MICQFVVWHCDANFTGCLTNGNVSDVLACLNKCCCNKPPPLPAIYPSGNIYPGFSLSLSLRCLKQSSLTHTETQTQTPECYPHISKLSQELLPKRAAVCLCCSVLQTGCWQQQDPCCSGIVTSPLFHQLTCVSILVGFYHLFPVFGPISSR